MRVPGARPIPRLLAHQHLTLLPVRHLGRQQLRPRHRATLHRLVLQELRIPTVDDVIKIENGQLQIVKVPLIHAFRRVVAHPVKHTQR